MKECLLPQAQVFCYNDCKVSGVAADFHDDTDRVGDVTAQFFPPSQRCATLGADETEGGEKMKQHEKRNLWAGLGLLSAFVLWTILITRVDVQPAGPKGTEVGFATLNLWFHRLTGVHMAIYTVTDWLGLVPIAVCLCFGGLGLVQMIRRKSLLRVDADILLLGLYYILVIFGYLFFEAVPINYRPILIEGRLEASYPSSTTLLVLSVMPTLMLQIGRRSNSAAVIRTVSVFTVLFTAFMVVGRLISGVHWATDIIGAVLLSLGLYQIYRFGVETLNRRRERSDGIQ